MFQTFIREGKHIPKDPPPYVATIFSPIFQDIVSMISSILGYTTSEYIDEIILAFMSIFTPGHPPAVMYDYAKYISDRMHEQFLRIRNERVFKYSSICTTFSYITKLTSSPSLSKSWTLKVILGQSFSGLVWYISMIPHIHTQISLIFLYIQ